MAKSSVLSNVLKYDLKIGMHQLAPLPYNDPQGDIVIDLVGNFVKYPEAKKKTREIK